MAYPNLQQYRGTTQMLASQIKTYIVIVNYKSAEDTEKCLLSLKKSDVPIKIVVVDNTPNDPSLDGVLAHFDDVHLIRAPENLGFGRGSNLGIEWALGQHDCKFVLILNNDTTIRSDAIKCLEDAMESHPEAAIVTPRIVLAEDESKLWYGGGEVIWYRGGARVSGWLGPANAPLALKSRYVSFASGCAMLVRKDVLKKIGGFDKRYFMYEEDVELCLRAKRQGFKIWYEPSAVIIHKGQGSLRKQNKGGFIGILAPENPNLEFYTYHVIKNRLLTMHSYASGKEKIQFTLYFIFFVLMKLYKFFLNRRWGAIIAVYQGWRAYRKEIRRR